MSGKQKKTLYENKKVFASSWQDYILVLLQNKICNCVNFGSFKNVVSYQWITSQCIVSQKLELKILIVCDVLQFWQLCIYQRILRKIKVFVSCRSIAQWISFWNFDIHSIINWNRRRVNEVLSLISIANKISYKENFLLL